ncbi:DUF397 domain-containing protein [Streptomyces hygroscopicus]|uniref:DUF397 domain-containing protein n=1 Tax=Streptomyces hygroscopicus TaxID=1912 RepID=A0ABQ3TVD5_STRHY|nr:DUF397 domain-containing protein [Streptomyces hygroscopicus]GHJ27295.1 hypothetical protein TPA0910_17280 [Streptomyces hygroscopicus]
MPAPVWRKSTFSEEASSCVYVAAAGKGKIRLRESDDPDVILSTTPASLRAFIRGAKAGDFDCLRQGGA